MGVNTQIVSVAPTNASTTGICLSQTPGGAGALTLNGAVVTAGIAVMGAAQKVTISCAGSDAGRSFIVRGVSADGVTTSETMAGSNASLTTSVGYYKSVTSITVDAATAGAITAGFTAVAVSPSVNLMGMNGLTTIGCTVTGTITFGAEFTMDGASWVTHGTITGKSAAFNDTIAYPVRAARLTVASATTGTVTGNFLGWTTNGR